MRWCSDKSVEVKLRRILSRGNPLKKNWKPNSAEFSRGNPWKMLLNYFSIHYVFH